jgi:hypothetical protein
VVRAAGSDEPHASADALPGLPLWPGKGEVQPVHCAFEQQREPVDVDVALPLCDHEGQAGARFVLALRGSRQRGLLFDWCGGRVEVTVERGASDAERSCDRVDRLFALLADRAHRRPAGIRSGDQPVPRLSFSATVGSLQRSSFAAGDTFLTKDPTSPGGAPRPGTEWSSSPPDRPRSRRR